MNFTETRSRLITKYYDLVKRFVRPLADKGVSPNTISVISLGLSFLSGCLYAFGLIFAGGIFLLLSGFTDTIDGAIARLTGQSTKFGALLDSTLDRYAEFFIYFGLMVYYRDRFIFYVVMLALMGSILVSYVKARAESLGRIRVVGLMQRPERFFLLVLGSLLNGPIGRYFPECPDCIFIAALILLAFLTNITVIHRLLAGKKDLFHPE